MFSYYGSKSKIANKYPLPQFDIIIEPFAGSARYALLHHTGHNVVIVEKNPVVAGIWKWLVQAQASDIRKLPIVLAGEPIPDIKPIEARWLIGFMFNQGSITPKNFAGRMNFCKLPGNSWEFLVNKLEWIRAWTVIEGDYWDAPDVLATWYIDPPYSGQSLYPFQSLDYNKLGLWCKSRSGQVMVCENSHATWLPFQPLLTNRGQRSTSKLLNEGLWTNGDIQ